MISVFLLGCQGPVGEAPKPLQNNNLLSSLKKITSDSSVQGLLGKNSSRTTEGTSSLNLAEADQAHLDTTIENPDYVLQKMSEEENGADQLALVNAMINEGTAEEVYNAMDAINPEIATNYESAMQKIVDNLPLEETTSRGLIYSDGRINLSKIHLNLTAQGGSRGLLAHNMEWDTIWSYVGVSAATTAGIIVYRFTPEWTPAGWFPIYTGWIRWIGLAAAGYGATTMGNQIYAWKDSGDILKMINFVLKLGQIKDMAIDLWRTSTDRNYIIEKVKTNLTENQVFINDQPFQKTIDDIVDKAKNSNSNNSELVQLFWNNYFQFGNGNDYGWRYTTIVAATTVPIVTVIWVTPELQGIVVQCAKAWNALSTFITTHVGVVTVGAKTTLTFTFAL